MKKIIFALIILVLGILFVRTVLLGDKEQRVTSKAQTTEKKQSVLGTDKSQIRSLFIPYWTFGSEVLETPESTELFYFGVAVNENGIDKEDPGFEKISDFINLSDSSKKRFLTIRMVDQEVTGEVLRNKNIQKEIISDSVEIAKENGFDGVVLDLETASVSFETVVERITTFNSEFYKAVHNNDLSYYVAIYGDTYYRARPYDIETIANNSDRILIMAYDFHKARGNPGPNFPLEGKNTYGYDFKTMISDYLKDSSSQKIVPIFGMFGYDWETDSSGDATETGVSSSTNSIQSKFVDSCSQNECKWERDGQSGEIRVTYTDGEDNKHIIWFEDEESVKRKLNYLNENGIQSYGYWAYSYY